MSHLPVRAAALACVALLAAAPGAAEAALGGNLASVMHDSEAVKGTHYVTPFSAYDLHETIADDGTVLREYLDRTGAVFAVTWHGPRGLDVDALLGARAPQYHAARTRLGNHHVATINEPDLVVTVMRLPRGWQGAALLPTALPAGVSRAELR